MSNTQTPFRVRVVFYDHSAVADGEEPLFDMTYTLAGFADSQAECGLYDNVDYAQVSALQVGRAMFFTPSNSDENAKGFICRIQ